MNGLDFLVQLLTSPITQAAANASQFTDLALNTSQVSNDELMKALETQNSVYLQRILDQLQHLERRDKMVLIDDFIIDQCTDELDGADTYISRALLLHETNEEMADMLCSMSEQEVGHFDKLLEASEEMIEKHCKTHGKAPEGMAATWDRERKRWFNKRALVTHKISNYKSL